MAVYMIGDLAKISGLSKHTLNYYIKENLIYPIDRSERNRYRYFNESTVERLNKIIHMRRQGLSIRQIKDKLAKE